MLVSMGAGVRGNAPFTYDQTGGGGAARSFPGREPVYNEPVS
jgi:hypothetical protein